MTTTENWNAPTLLVDDITVVAPPAERPEQPVAPVADGHTSLPPEDRGEIGPRRDLSQTTSEDRFNLWGALVAGMALALLLFGWFAPLTGEVGWAASPSSPSSASTPCWSRCAPTARPSPTA